MTVAQNALRAQPLAGDHIALVDAAEDRTGGNAGRSPPALDRRLRPRRHGHGPHAPFLADQVDHAPAPVALLDVLERQPDGFVAPQPAADQHRQDRAVPFSLVGRRIRSGEQHLGLALGQPVAGADAVLRGAADVRMPCAAAGSSSPLYDASAASFRTAESF